MNLSFFIARRLLGNTETNKAVSKPVINISVWAIAIGLCIMIIALATGIGLRNEISRKVVRFGGDVQIMNYQPNPVLDQAGLVLNDSTLQHLRAQASVQHLQAFGKKAGILKAGDIFEGVVLKGVDKDYNWDNFKPFLRSGNTLQLNDSTTSDSILLSTSMAGKLNLNLGDKVAVYFVRESPKPPLLRYFYLGGLYSTDFEEIDNSLVIGDIGHIRRMNKWEENEVSGYEIFVTEGSSSDDIALNLRYALPLEYDALSSRQLYQQLYQWLDLFDFNIGLILLIILVVGTVNICIALLILILERSKTIGIFKALGSSNWLLQKIFLTQAAFLIGRGLLYGNILGIGLCLLQQHFQFIKLDPQTYYVSSVAVELNPLYLIGLNLLVATVSLLCLLLPSLLVSSIKPVKVLRFD